MPAVSVTPQLAVCTRSREGTAVVVISGELDLCTRDELKRSLLGVLDQRPERLVLDLAGVTFMDCSAARVLAAASRALPGGGRAVIWRISWPAARLLQLAGLSACFSVPGSSPRHRTPRPRRRPENRAVRRADQAVR